MTLDVEKRLTQAWQRRGLLAWALLPFSLLFLLLTSFRRLLYRAGLLRSTRLRVPVVIVGNVFVGGTGKTPLTIWLVEQLRAGGLVPGVISRGYGAKTDVPLHVTPETSATTVGDEPTLIVQRTGCPVVVGRDRVSAAKALLQAHPDVTVIVSDDGLQHYALQRDVEIVLADERGNGNGWVLPAGPLRELGSRRRDFTVVNAASSAVVEGQAFRMQLIGAHAEQLVDRTQVISLSELTGKQIVAAAGIGNPSRFFAMLRKSGLFITEMPLPDHFDFSRNPFAAVDAEVILITEKDAVKCRQLDTIKNDARIWVVPVTARIDNALAEQIVEKCRGRPIA